MSERVCAKKPRKKKMQLRIDQTRITGVNPKHTHGLGLWHNPREVYSVRVDKGLAKAFTPVAMAYFGSTCKAIETYMSTIVGLHNNNQLSGVYPSNTCFDVGAINIVREMQTHRKLTRIHTETDVVEEEKIEREVTVTCGFKDCSGVVVARGLYVPKNVELPLCEKHLKLASESSFDWRILA